METNDLLAIKSMIGEDHSHSDMTSYEQAMLTMKSSKHPSNVGITGLVLGTTGLAIGIGAWIFSGIYSAGRAKSNENLIAMSNNNTNNTLNNLANVLAAERLERINDKAATNQTIIDIVSNPQANSTSNSISNAYSQAEAQILTNALTGRMQTCPTPVSIFQAAKPCDCINTCGCNN